MMKDFLGQSTELRNKCEVYIYDLLMTYGVGGYLLIPQWHIAVKIPNGNNKGEISEIMIVRGLVYITIAEYQKSPKTYKIAEIGNDDLYALSNELDLYGNIFGRTTADIWFSYTQDAKENIIKDREKRADRILDN